MAEDSSEWVASFLLGQIKVTWGDQGAAASLEMQIHSLGLEGTCSLQVQTGDRG